MGTIIVEMLYMPYRLRLHQLTISDVLMFDAARTIALGGVATGNINA